MLAERLVIGGKLDGTSKLPTEDISRPRMAYFSPKRDKIALLVFDLFLTVFLNCFDLTETAINESHFLAGAAAYSVQLC